MYIYTNILYCVKDINRDQDKDMACFLLESRGDRSACAKNKDNSKSAQ